MKETKFAFNRQTKLDDDFFYVSSLNPTFKKTDHKFEISDNCILNSYNEEISDYDYISILTKKKYKNGAKISTHCDFKGYGAPIIVISDDVRAYENGDKYYGLHFEVVAYSLGCNIWQIIPLPEGSKEPIENRKIANLPFEIGQEEPVSLTIEVCGHTIKVTLNGRELLAESPDIPDSFHVGLTACEGINKFYDMTIEGEEA